MTQEPTQRTTHPLSSHRHDLFTDLAIIVGFVALATMMIALEAVSVVVLTTLAVAFCLHVAGMIPQTDYDGPGVVVLGLYFVSMGLVIGL